MKELDFRDNAGHLGGAWRKWQIKHSRFKGIDLYDKLPGNIRQTQNLDSFGNAAKPCPKQMSFPVSRQSTMTTNTKVG